MVLPKLIPKMKLKVFGPDRKKGEAINEHRYNQKAVVLLEKEGFGFMISLKIYLF